MYAAKAIAAQNTGLDVKSVSRQAQGVEDGSAANDIIEIDDNGLEELVVSMTSLVRVKDDPNPKQASAEALGTSNEELEPTGRGQHVRTKRTPFSLKMKGAYHNGVGFPQVRGIQVDYKKESIMGMYQGARYASRKGVINVKVDSDAPPPPEMTQE